MQDLASVSTVDVRGSRVKRVVFAVVLAAVVAAAGVIAYTLLTAEPGAKACDHLAELRETDPRADQVIDRLERYVETHVVEQKLVDGQRRVEVSGSTPDERCRSAIDKLDQAMGHGPFTRLVECIASAKTARSAAMCF